MASSLFSVFPNLILKNSSPRRRRIGMFVANLDLEQNSVFHLKSHKQDSVKDMMRLNFEQKLEMARSMLISQVKQPASAIGMIDMLQKLGIDYHFSKEIETITSDLYESFSTHNGSLHHVALGFRLLRQHGYYTSPDVFCRFMNNKGQFEVSLKEDLRGLLSLYEASHMDIGEDILCTAKEFSSEHLKACINNVGVVWKRNIEHALEKPIHLSLQRNNVRHYICQLEGEHEMSNALKELAITDFNHVQSLHRKEYSEYLRWWKMLDLSKESQLFRDQPMKWFAWTTAAIFEPRLSKHRLLLAKVVAILYVIDDFFDVLGSHEELIQFTEAVERWEASPTDSPLCCTKKCYHELYNVTNEMVNFVLSEHGWNPLDTLRKSWASLCKAFLLETRWFTSGITPKAAEYLKNGLTTTGIPMVFIHFYTLLGDEASRETVAMLNNDTFKSFELIALSLRLWDDLGSAKDENQEGLDGSYLECYMKEYDASLESARKHAMEMISNAWKELNKECLLSNNFSQSFKQAMLNTVRMINVMYTYEDQRLPMLEEYSRLNLLEDI
ncbi:hypothetical protein HPP92_023582 [Vanilla planifolia]|uniref:Uncharacterized protein n=1 Tax=Vanilla planifolia TaxID=51239 RepID=A0A835UES1_VANPL|nr:hypothetical protein HPP92_023582 [Vanilla planifolia]